MIIKEFKGLKNNKIRFICGDNMEFLKKMEDNMKWQYYHVAVVDPPYGIDITKMRLGKTTEETKAIMEKRDRGSWDSKPPDAEYFRLLFWISRNQVIWGANYMLKEIGKSCDKFLLWDKEQPAGLSFADCEFAWTSYEGAPKMCKRSRLKDVKHDKIHDTQKPVYLYEWTFMQLKKHHDLQEGQRVLDTHGGSHNIAIAAYRQCLSIDIIERELEYHETGIENFLKHTQQGRIELSDEVVKPVTKKVDNSITLF